MLKKGFEVTHCNIIQVKLFVLYLYVSGVYKRFTRLLFSEHAVFAILFQLNIAYVE